MTIVTAAIATTPASVIRSATDWRTAVTDLIQWLVDNGRCFSSGEIAAYLRTYGTHLSFKVSGVGEYVRDAFDNGTIPEYADGIGGTVYASQVARTCQGIARTLDGRTVTTKTPVGTTVMVYAPNGWDGFAHDFEVYIPDYDDPTASRATQYSAGVAVVPTSTVTPTTQAPTAPVRQITSAVVITGALSRQDLTAYVRPDRRVTVPRAAFEAWVNLTGTPLRGGPNGDPIYVDVDGSTVTITLTATPTSQAYTLWANRGRIAIHIPTSTPGDKFDVKVTASAMTIDLSQKV